MLIYLSFPNWAAAVAGPARLFSEQTADERAYIQYPVSNKKEHDSTMEQESIGKKLVWL